ncbi:MAG: hypothetical protein JJ953_00870 [Gracilimonas sp.]|uniref:hypothetical protein n=1 Tax=Gracilimonas TaxID=649462 RepID=UPI001B0F7BA3|nr:hypothetical protein [Gracilimonas sp.]MBO6584633.1 hypothetical protein [Gracilimonas sp.]MBO6616096.1 hypothetical protein [Gracilimonas sp.]
MKGSQVLLEGIYNWKLRLVLSALLCIIGLGILISMALGIFLELTVLDKSIVGIAIFMVGTPAYLIVSNLGKVDQYTIAGFLNESLKEVDGDAEVLVKKEDELDPEEKTRREQLEEFFRENPLYNFLPDRPVKQAYFLFLISLLASFAIWYFGP